MNKSTFVYLILVIASGVGCSNSNHSTQSSATSQDPDFTVKERSGLFCDIENVARDCKMIGTDSSGPIEYDAAVSGVRIDRFNKQILLHNHFEYKADGKVHSFKNEKGNTGYYAVNCLAGKIEINVGAPGSKNGIHEELITEHGVLTRLSAFTKEPNNSVRAEGECN